MITAVWASLGFFVAASLAGTAWVASSAWVAWRQARPVPRRVLAELDELARRVGALERRAGDLAGGGEVLRRNAAHLSASLARLRTLLEVLQDARAALRAVRAFLPAK